MSQRRPARFRSVYVNGLPVWECNRCGTRRPPATTEPDLRRHESSCGQPTSTETAHVV